MVHTARAPSPVEPDPRDMWCKYKRPALCDGQPQDRSGHGVNLVKASCDKPVGAMPHGDGG